MYLFRHDRENNAPHVRKLYALYELAYTLVDVTAALLFLTGSIMFFNKSLENPAIWCFVFGSVFFAVKPILRIIREVHLAADGDFENLARRLGR